MHTQKACLSAAVELSFSAPRITLPLSGIKLMLLPGSWLKAHVEAPSFSADCNRLRAEAAIFGLHKATRSAEVSICSGSLSVATAGSTGKSRRMF